MNDGGMRIELSAEQVAKREEFRRFAKDEIAPHAGEWERQEGVSKEFINQLRKRRYLGTPFPEEVGGGGMDAITYGILTEEIGRGCSSARSLLTVHDMTSFCIFRWGSKHLKETILPRLTSAELLGAFALTEPDVGSDARHITTRARFEGDEIVIDGCKKWITYGQIADIFLVMAIAEEGPTAFLVPADTPGLSRKPIRGLMGTAASMLAELTFDGCRIPRENVVGRPGFGFSHVGAAGLNLGRYSVAWGSVGIAQACLDACLDYTSERHQFGKPLRDHQLIQRKLTEMIVSTRAARLLCYRAGYLRQIEDPGSATETQIAKYSASRAATAAAASAVQLHGANGLSSEYPVARYLRDSRAMEIIEGSTQIMQVLISKHLPEEI
jgi:alkylation response protein AidB-like acyl-CoA dehydrogenase